jgi:sugar/nucleoside kinase (ribokinase family)
LDMISFGSIFLELVFGHVPEMPGPGEEVFTEEFAFSCGGAVNSASAAASAGARAGLCTVLGDDLGSRVVIEHCARVGVDLSPSVRVRRRSAGVTVVLNFDGDRAFVTNLPARRGEPGAGARGEPGAGARGERGAGARGERGAGARGEPGAGARGEPGAGARGEPEAGARGEPEAGRQEERSERRGQPEIERWREVLRRYRPRWCYVHGGPGVPEFLREARELGSKIALDVSLGDERYRRDAIIDCVRLADVFLPNEDEILRLTGTDALGPALAAATAWGTPLVVTRGAAGAVIASPDGITEVAEGVQPVTVRDLTGAGDAFAGALIAALVRGVPLTKAVVAANTAGSQAAARLGAVGEVDVSGIAAVGQVLGAGFIDEAAEFTGQAAADNNAEREISQ